MNSKNERKPASQPASQLAKTTVFPKEIVPLVKTPSSPSPERVYESMSTQAKLRTTLENVRDVMAALQAFTKV